METLDSPDAAPVATSLYVLGSFIAVMLASIAGLLCFAICIRPLMSMAPVKHGYDNVDAAM